MLIISFNIVGSLSMLVIEKTRDISILKTMGADNKMIRQVFLLEGVLSATIGAGIGIFLGFILCLLQLKYGFIKLSNGDNSFVVQSYPIVMKFGDFLLTFITVVFIAFVASYIPAKRASESVLKFKE
jgi:lipoprotein-releasing system permease protein